MTSITNSYNVVSNVHGRAGSHHGNMTYSHSVFCPVLGVRRASLFPRCSLPTPTPTTTIKKIKISNLGRREVINLDAVTRTDSARKKLTNLKTRCCLVAIVSRDNLVGLCFRVPFRILWELSLTLIPCVQGVYNVFHPDIVGKSARDCADRNSRMQPLSTYLMGYEEDQRKN